MGSTLPSLGTMAMPSYRLTVVSGSHFIVGSNTTSSSRTVRRRSLDFHIRTMSAPWAWPMLAIFICRRSEPSQTIVFSFLRPCTGLSPAASSAGGSEGSPASPPPPPDMSAAALLWGMGGGAELGPAPASVDAAPPPCPLPAPKSTRTTELSCGAGAPGATCACNASLAVGAGSTAPPCGPLPGVVSAIAPRHHRDDARQLLAHGIEALTRLQIVEVGVLLVPRVQLEDGPHQITALHLAGHSPGGMAAGVGQIARYLVARLPVVVGQDQDAGVRVQLAQQRHHVRQVASVQGHKNRVQPIDGRPGCQARRIALHNQHQRGGVDVDVTQAQTAPRIIHPPLVNLRPIGADELQRP